MLKVNATTVALVIPYFVAVSCEPGAMIELASRDTDV